MRRGMSKAYINRSVVSRARELVLSDVFASSESEHQSLHVAETPVFTFVLPNINIYPDGFKAFLYKELIESPTLVSLEQGGETISVENRYAVKPLILVTLNFHVWANLIILDPVILAFLLPTTPKRYCIQIFAARYFCKLARLAKFAN